LGQLLYASKIVAEKEGIAEGFRVVINNGPDACKFFFFTCLSVFIFLICYFLEKAEKPVLIRKLQKYPCFLSFAEKSSLLWNSELGPTALILLTAHLHVNKWMSGDEMIAVTFIKI
jgi:hypothetical protein